MCTCFQVKVDKTCTGLVHENEVHINIFSLSASFPVQSRCREQLTLSEPCFILHHLKSLKSLKLQWTLVHEVRAFLRQQVATEFRIFSCHRSSALVMVSQHHAPFLRVPILRVSGGYYCSEEYRTCGNYSV